MNQIKIIINKQNLQKSLVTHQKNIEVIIKLGESCQTSCLLLMVICIVCDAIVGNYSVFSVFLDPFFYVALTVKFFSEKYTKIQKARLLDSRQIMMNLAIQEEESPTLKEIARKLWIEYFDIDIFAEEI